MRSRTIASIAVALMTVLSFQPGLLGGSQELSQGAPSAEPAGITVTGTALRTDLAPLPSATVRLRHFDSASSVVVRATTGRSGEFAFAGVLPGNYLLELVDSSGRLVGMAPPFAVTDNGPVAVSIVASGSDAEASTEGGFRLFGLGPAATAAVLGAASAVAVTAVVATKPTASPSR
jgi:Carboxypeptidase regulatory-like domain